MRVAGSVCGWWGAACADGGLAAGGPCCCARAHPCQPFLGPRPMSPCLQVNRCRPVAAWAQPGEHLGAAQPQHAGRGCFALLWHRPVNALPEYADVLGLLTHTTHSHPTPAQPPAQSPEHLPRPAGFPPHLASSATTGPTSGRRSRSNGTRCRATQALCHTSCGHCR